LTFIFNHIFRNKYGFDLIKLPYDDVHIATCSYHGNKKNS